MKRARHRMPVMPVETKKGKADVVSRANAENGND